MENAESLNSIGLENDADEEILIKEELSSDELFSSFISQTEDLMETLDVFYQLCESLEINPKNYKTVYQSLTSRLTSWKCKNLWNKIDKKAKHPDYKNRPCGKMKAVVIGAGPCGLRTAVELALLGAQVIVLEKRDSFSRNNVLHLWPFLIVDLKSLGAKVFYGKFCAGSLDHISIRKLQCILLKVCLILGVQVYPKTSFQELIEPSEGRGWRVKTSGNHPDIWNLDIDAIVGADGKKNTLKGFKMKEFRGKLAIGITVNFVNKNSQQEAAMEEISGVAFIYNQQFFQELKDKTAIDLENIVYYKDDTHYFVMTAKKKSLLEKGVIKTDNADAKKLLASTNVDHLALLNYAQEAVDFSTHYQLPHHEFAVNHVGKEDVAMFDFTSMHAAENASRIVERRSKRLLMCIVGDTLIEPFWPTGSGCARGFLSSFDAAWSMRSMGLGREPLDIIQERESILRYLAQTKPGNMMNDHHKYSINPATRYPNCNTKSLKKHNVKHLYDKTDIAFKSIDYDTINVENIANSPKVKEQGNSIDAYRLLKWCQEQTKDYPGVNIIDMASSWKNGLGFCAIINRYRPDLLDFFSLDENDAEKNCQIAFDTAEEHLGIPPKMSGKDFTSTLIPDRLTVISYLSLYYDIFKTETPVLMEESNGKRAKAVFWKSLRTFAIVGTNNNDAKQNQPASPIKSPVKTNKMSIIARLSRRSKKKIRKLDSRLTKEKKANKENRADDSSQSKIATKTNDVSQDKQKLISSGSEPSSPEHKLDMIKENNDPLKSLQLSEVEKKDNVASGTAFAVSGVQTAANESDEKPQALDSKRVSRINMLAETVFGVSTKQAIAEAEATLSESELCHFCKRRVYVMERMSAEGMFFHRQCFRCSVCKCTLLLGNYAFDAADDDKPGGNFYCKPHFNRLLYEKPKESVDQIDNVKSPGRSRKNRPATQIVQRTDVQKAFPIHISENISAEKERGRSLSDMDTRTPHDEDIIVEKKNSPYNKFEAKTLLVRHPSLTRQDSKNLSPNKSSPPTSNLQHAVSSPALQKLFNEDNEFGQDLRKRAELKDKSQERRRHLRRLKPSLEMQKSIEKDLARDDSFIPGRPETPKNKKKMLLKAEINDDDDHELKPVSVDICIDDDAIDMGAKEEETPKGRVKKKKKYVLKKKKEKKSHDVIPEEKELISSPEIARALSPVIDVMGEVEPSIVNREKDIGTSIAEADANVLLDEIDSIEQKSSDVKEMESKEKKKLKSKKGKSAKKEKESKDKKKKKRKSEEKNADKDEDTDWVVVNIRGDVEKQTESRNMTTDDSSDESDDEKLKTKSSDGFFSRVLGTKSKRVLKTAEEIEEEEQKKKRKEMKKIQQAVNERRLKRLWEAQSIQRKLNEVEVKQTELDERAKSLERTLRRPYLKPEEEGPLMLDWFQLVNDKNVLLRFESELVIQASNIQYEDQQARLEADIRALLTSDDPKPDDQEWIEVLTKELVDTVEQRNNLVEMLEEDRIRELEEDKNLQELMALKAKELGMDRLV